MAYGISYLDDVSTGARYFGLDAPRATPAYRIGKQKGTQRKSESMAMKLALYGKPACANKLNFD